MALDLFDSTLGPGAASTVSAKPPPRPYQAVWDAANATNRVGLVDVGAADTGDDVTDLGTIAMGLTGIEKHRRVLELG